MVLDKVYGAFENKPLLLYRSMLIMKAASSKSYLQIQKRRQNVTDRKITEFRLQLCRRACTDYMDHTQFYP